MAGSTFKTNPYDLHELLKDCHQGKLQLPDFQRSWVWDEDRITSLIASISRAFPIGALMTLETGGAVDFKPRTVEGAPKNASRVKPQSLLLDGQQRITSLYQVALRGKVVQTITPKKKRVDRWFYIDIRKALDDTVDREKAIVSVPENKVIATDFGREVLLDLTTVEHEFDLLMYPVSMAFRWDDWQKHFIEHSMKKGDFSEKWKVIKSFKENLLDNYAKYQVPVIALGPNTSKEAVCVVFEKVNTGGKPLDAFELVTAMYAAAGHELRRDWYPGPVAADWPDLLEIVERLVKPERMLQKRDVLRQRWWQYADKRPALRAATSILERLIVAPQVTQYPIFALSDNGRIFSQKTIVFADDRTSTLANLSSRTSELWICFFTSTMKDDLNYSPSDCFLNSLLATSPAVSVTLSTVGLKYHDHRAAIMQQRNEGLTNTYNRFHDAAEYAPDIAELRELHHAVDQAVLRAYGWHDLAAAAVPEFLDEDTDPDHRYHGRLFWPAPFRDEVLSRLLALDAERAAAERAMDLSPGQGSDPVPDEEDVAA